MKRSIDRVLTTHVGSLARPHDLLDTLKERENGRPYDGDLLDRQITDAVADRVRLQVEYGIDIVTDGEMSKVSFLGYVKDRLGGFEPDMDDVRMAPSWQKEVDDFPEYYAEYFKKYSATITPLRRIVCKGPITYIGQRAGADRHRQPHRRQSSRTTSPTCSCRRPDPAGSEATSTTDRTRSTSPPSPRRCARSTWRSSTPASSCRSTTRSSSTC